MALGKRREEQQQAFWVSAESLGSGPRNVFYNRIRPVNHTGEMGRCLAGRVPSTIPAAAVG